MTNQFTYHSPLQKKKSSESYELQQLRHEIETPTHTQSVASSESEDERLVATGRTTLSIDANELPQLPVGLIE